MQAAAIELRAISKRFGGNVANDRVDIRIESGTIHGIVGENGAGKSTLMNILYGYLKADSGAMLVDGSEVEISQPRHAIAAGIGMVHQHFMLVEPLTVLENMLLGSEGGVTLKRGMTAARREIARIERDYGLEVDLDAVVGELAVGLQQRVEILKALYRGARTLILDEPTGVLTPQEADHLFSILRNLKMQGRSVILITHKLGEIMRVTDRVSVMRRGQMVAHLETRATSREQLAELMVGRAVLFQVAKGPARPGPEVLRVEALDLKDERGVARLKDLSFSVHAGEIVGVAGVSGNGQSELLEVLGGMRSPTRGSIAIRGKMTCWRSIREQGVAHVPEDRLRNGLVRGMKAYENAILGYHRRRDYGGFFLSIRTILSRTRDWFSRYDIRPHDVFLNATSFSGGNQQKLVMAREIEHGPVLLLIGQPTRGVDVGAIELIHRRIVELRDQGMAVLIVSVELEEIMSLADRILVMADGRISGRMPTAMADERAIGMMMADGDAVAAD
ncbi:nucleoside ABC transporter ATP-binding protein [Arboricoccus pini]|uniref:Nucleoside ABC transporter ATP-binding protein n=1 Tax=Arboricoccus pini TaxID=1963835 RepID=A0A212QTD0_9PROT|nr:ABC transporter ATP-binding protein [Arboricoccus pini]SNB62890.1 nucleoside ABC transporter ATP-binding protein [Arboricoccus pini]